MEGASGNGNSITRRRFLRWFEGWTSLDATKVGVDILKATLFPAAILYAGRQISRMEKVDEKLVERRVKSVDVVAPAANDILCFVTIVGHWKSLNPTEVIKRKRDIAAEMWSSRPLWSETTWAGYRNFMTTVFKEYGGGPGENAKIYGDIPLVRSEMKEIFKDDWTNAFIQLSIPWKDWKDNVTNNYIAYVTELRNDLGIT